MDANLAALKASLDTYMANVATVMDAHNAEVADAVANAIADDDAGEAADLQAMKAQIDAANAKLVPPVFEPSNN